MRLASLSKLVMLMACLCLSDGVTAQQFPPRFEPEPEIERLPDPERGERLFRECRKCHETTPDLIKIGPSLAGVVGRRPGSVPGFGYSQDLVDYGGQGIVWNANNLDQFLTRPRALIAGTKMVFQGFRKPEDRSDLIAYLSTIR